MERADVVVLGMGPGGEEAAGRLAAAGLDVVGIEAELVGGECPYWGCVPTKMVIRGANLLAEARRVGAMSGSASVTADFSPVARRIREEATDTWDDTVAAERFTSKGGRLVRGRGMLVGPRTVEVDGRTIEADRAVVVATGARAWTPPVPGLDATPYWINRDAVAATEAPSSLAILGGGPIGVELGQAFARFGSQVTIIEAGPRLVAPEEPESAVRLAEVFEREGIVVRTGGAVEAVRHDGTSFHVGVEGGPDVTAERLLVAAGRRVDLASIGAASVGVDEGLRGMPVDERMRVVGAPGVYAIGDVTGVGPFTHVSMYQAGIVVADLLGEEHGPADYRALPHVTFTDPEIGSVGLTEAQARASGLNVRTGSSVVAASARGWIHKAGNEGYIKLIEDRDGGFLVGATSMGPWGGEVLGLLALAVQERTSTRRLAEMIYAYPTFHRGILDAVNDLRSR